MSWDWVSDIAEAAVKIARLVIDVLERGSI